MIGLPYNVFVQRAPTAEPWRAPIWRSFPTEDAAISGVRGVLGQRDMDRPAVYAEINRPDGSSREFVWLDGEIQEA